MNGSQCKVVVTVRNAQGLHMRPLDTLVRAANNYKCEITVERLSQRVDCRNFLSMLSLGAEMGTQLTIEAIGDDAAQAIAEICELFENRFGEDDEN